MSVAASARRDIRSPMKIERVIIRGLRALEDRDDRLSGPDGVWGSACVRGLNGSGKTTWLEALAELWQWFRRCTKKRGWVEPSRDPGGTLLREGRLVAARISGLPGPRPSVWLAWGEIGEIAGLLSGEEDPSIRIVDGRPRWDPEFLSWWDGEATRAELGQGLVPNMMIIGAENKQVAPLKRGELLSAEAGPVMLALHRYWPASHGSGHLEAQIGTLKLVREDRYQELGRWVQMLFPGLELAGFDEASRRPLFRLSASGRLLTVDRLSAGERSVLINLVTMVRGLARGGVVLLDEPELHQHLSLMRGSMAVLERVVQGLDGQLLVASHAPEVWDHFRPTGAFIELPERASARA